jgi:hypothetical protein
MHYEIAANGKCCAGSSVMNLLANPDIAKKIALKDGVTTILIIVMYPIKITGLLI